MHRPNWLRFFVTQLVVLSWRPFPVRTERQPVGVLQDAGVPHPGPADTLNSDYSFHEDGRDGCMPAQTVCAESSARQAHLWWYGPRMDRTYYVLSATSILPSPLEKSIKPGETIAATSGPGGTLRMHRPNWLRFFVTQLVVLSWRPFPVRTERQPVGVLQDAGVPHPGPADTLNSDYSFHEDGRDGCMPAQTVCAESSARQAHLWWYGPRMDRTYYVLSATSILPSPLEKSIKPGETIAATSGPGGTLRMHRPNWLRFFVTQLVVLSWRPFPVRTERQPVGVLQDAGVPHPGPADTLNSDYSFHEDGRDGCMPAQTVCAESSARQAHLWCFVKASQFTSDISEELALLRRQNVVHLGILNMYDYDNRVLEASFYVEPALDEGHHRCHHLRVERAQRQCVHRSATDDLSGASVTTRPDSTTWCKWLTTVSSPPSQVLAFAFQMGTLIYNMTYPHRRPADAVYENCSGFIIGDSSQLKEEILTAEKAAGSVANVQRRTLFYTYDTVETMREKAEFVMTTNRKRANFTWFLFNVHLTDISKKCRPNGPFERLREFRKFHYDISRRRQTV
ncbi:hypothetical protein MRX96_031501 [Rhipicephalus microplus]